MNVLQHTRNELNLYLKENRPDRSYRDTLLNPGTELSVRNKDVRCIVEGRNQSLVSSMTQAIEESKLMCLVSF